MTSTNLNLERDIDLSPADLRLATGPLGGAKVPTTMTTGIDLPDLSATELDAEVDTDEEKEGLAAEPFKAMDDLLLTPEGQVELGGAIDGLGVGVRTEVEQSNIDATVQDLKESGTFDIVPKIIETGVEQEIVLEDGETITVLLEDGEQYKIVTLDSGQRVFLVSNDLKASSILALATEFAIDQIVEVAEFHGVVVNMDTLTSFVLETISEAVTEYLIHIIGLDFTTQAVIKLIEDERREMEIQSAERR